MKEYVYIQSTKSIVVTAGLQNDNVTNPDAHVGDRLRINPMWPKMSVLIKRGRNVYPSFIKDWATVKALVKDNVLTIGEEVEDIDDNAMKEKAKDIKAEMKKVKDISLEKIAAKEQ